MRVGSHVKRSPTPSSEQQDDRDRMIAATERLAALLADAGPNIVVRPLGLAADELPDALRRLTSADDDPASPPATARDASCRETTDPSPQPPARASTSRPARLAGSSDPSDATGRSRGRLRSDANPSADSEASARSGSLAESQVESPAESLAESLAQPPAPASAATSDAKHRAQPQPRPAPSTATFRLDTARGELHEAIAASRRAFVATGVFSLVINILMLTGPIFMLQVYDRVLTSGSYATLVVLSIMTAVLYGIIGILELVRTRVVARIGAEVDQRIGDRVFEASLRRSVHGQGTSLPALRELDTLRQFLASQGPITFFDIPWTPVYLLVIFLMHWTLGIAATLGAAALFAVAWIGERRSRTPIGAAGKSAFRSIELAETGQRNAEAITAMGMLEAYRARWRLSNREAVAWQLAAADEIGSTSAISKTLRLLMQSMMLAIGAALAIAGDLSAGAIVAGTIIFGRALAPVEQAVGQWRAFLKARESYDKLDDLLRKEPPAPARTALPAPEGRLTVTSLRVTAPDTRKLILNNINFEVRPGQMLAVIGPSASGKSTLARTLVGLWPPVAGHVRLDGARIDQWSHEDLGRHIGYLPQSVELFAGTVRENIARFRTDARDEDVVAAAEQAHAHELILGLPNGYETQLGAFATYLSAGQRQRIGLARALFGRPALVVLDEPNSNLDRVGDEALASAVDGMRARGQTVVLVSHRVQAITMADLLLYIDRGTQRAFGTRDEVMRLFQQPQSQAQPTQPGKPAPGNAAQTQAQGARA